ncbi:glycosyltransferase family 39 protein [Phyllobacterium sp. 0TCS1.6C]|uniref:glycosyltransferase family 39 protein n=1 Tax=unclassified Phyllobacterium TaxID=2638441 RepID=UPI002264B029|nr:MULTISPECIES: glycosyltransferase family 39 protein [unclassified Phyllobacterium]MCX8282572.1 glycosyltransferase family 39 protein [Phyllobacterium sp. 0TCS1.6C]MCX8292496.1 glycosyltransferase family 39 protein [Phyllobacterium sp. 0TCS1.6A]
MTPIPEQTARNNFWLENWPILFILLYFAFQIFYLTSISNGAGLDDAEQLAYIGALQAGYGGSQAPLYTWINSMAAGIFGISLATLYLVKFSMLASLFLSVYFGARLLGLPKAVAAAGMLGVFMLPQIAWESQRTLTHSVAGTTGCAWAFLAFAWHMKSRSWLSAALLGLGLAAGLLGKFNAAFFMVAIVIAGLSIPAYRAVLLSRRSLVTLVVFLVAIGPTALWSLEHTENALARADKFQINDGGNFILSRLHGAWELVLNGILFAGVALAIFGIEALRGRNNKVVPDRPMHDGEELVKRILILALSIVLVGVLISGAAQVKDRWLQPVLFLSPLFFAIVIHRNIAGLAALKRYCFVGVACALLVVPVLAVNLLYARDGNKPSIGQLDYAGLFAQTRQSGDYRSVMSDGPQLPGNLRLSDTKLQPIHFEMPNALEQIQFPMLVVWFGHDPNPRVVALLESAGLKPPAATEMKHVTLPYKYYPSSSEEVSYFILSRP